MRAISATVLLAALGCDWVGSPPRHGGDLYRHYCASCHGVSGRGDGPAAGALSPRPPDLTQSTAGVPELMRIIDGRRTIRAHGEPAMPVWGDVFEAALEGSGREHRQALRNVEALAEYMVHLRRAGPRETSDRDPW